MASRAAPLADLVRADLRANGHLVKPRLSSIKLPDWCGICGRNIRKVDSSYVHQEAPR